MPRRKSTAAKAKGESSAPSAASQSRRQPSKSRQSLKLAAPAEGKAKPQSVLVACAVALLTFAVWRRTLGRQARPEYIALLKHDQAACKDECWVSEGGGEADLNESPVIAAWLPGCGVTSMLSSTSHLRLLPPCGIPYYARFAAY